MLRSEPTGRPQVVQFFDFFQIQGWGADAVQLQVVLAIGVEGQAQTVLQLNTEQGPAIVVALKDAAAALAAEQQWEGEQQAAEQNAAEQDAATGVVALGESSSDESLREGAVGECNILDMPNPMGDGWDGSPGGGWEGEELEYRAKWAGETPESADGQPWAQWAGAPGRDGGPGEPAPRAAGSAADTDRWVELDPRGSETEVALEICALLQLPPLPAGLPARHSYVASSRGHLVDLWRFDPGGVKPALRHAGSLGVRALPPGATECGVGEVFGGDSPPAAVRALAVVPAAAGRGWLLASGSVDGVLRLWAVAVGGAECVVELRGHRHGAEINTLAGARQAGGRPVLLSGSDDQTVRLWADAGSGWACIATYQLSPDGCALHQWVTSAAVTGSSGAQQLVAASGDGGLRVWPLPPESESESDPAGATSPETLEGHRGVVWALAGVGGDSDHAGVFASGGDDRTVRLWQGSGFGYVEVATLRAARPARGTNGGIHALAWLPSTLEGSGGGGGGGKLGLAVAAADGSVRVWAVWEVVPAGWWDSELLATVWQPIAPPPPALAPPAAEQAVVSQLVDLIGCSEEEAATAAAAVGNDLNAAIEYQFAVEAGETPLLPPPEAMPSPAAPAGIWSMAVLRLRAVARPNQAAASLDGLPTLAAALTAAASEALQAAPGQHIAAQRAYVDSRLRSVPEFLFSDLGAGAAVEQFELLRQAYGMPTTSEHRSVAAASAEATAGVSEGWTWSLVCGRADGRVAVQALSPAEDGGLPAAVGW
jgi:hypothetical protein